MGGQMDKMASKVGETMKETQRSLQDEIITLQMQNQVRGQDRMMRQQMAIGMAMSRTQAEVFGEISAGFATLGVLLLAAGKIKGNPGTFLAGRILMAPAVATGLVAGTNAYYGWKCYGLNGYDRFKEHYDDIVKKDDEWFLPVLPPKDDYKNVK